MKMIKFSCTETMDERIIGNQIQISISGDRDLGKTTVAALVAKYFDTLGYSVELVSHNKQMSDYTKLLISNPKLEYIIDEVNYPVGVAILDNSTEPND